MAPPQAAAAAAVVKASIVPRSLTAPDAWISLLLLLYLQYQQLCRARQRKAFQRGRIIQTKKTKNREGATAAADESRPAASASSSSRARLSSSLIHEWLFTNLTVMTSPFSQMASNLNAQMVDLQSDRELHNYAQMVAASSPSEDGGSAAAAAAAAAAGGSRGGRGKKGRASKSASGKEPLVKGTIEIRTRRIKSSEMVFQSSPIPIYPILETVLNISLSLALGLLSRWLWGLVRSLRLSSLRGSVVGGGVGVGGGGGSSGGGVVVGGGPCCSPYRGGDDPGSRMVGSFERLLACVLIKGEGDEAGNFILSALGVVLLFVGVVGLAWNVSLPPSLHDNDDDEDDEDGDGDNSNNNEDDDDDKSSKGAFDPKKVKRFFIGVISTIASLWLFHTPPLLRTLGLGGLHNAAEEWSVRLILFLQLVGIIASSSSSSSSLSSYSSVVVVVDETSGVPVLGIPPSVQFLMNTFFILLALAWGYIASAMMIPIQETARNAAYVLSPSTSSSLSPGSSTTNNNNNNKRRGQKSSSTASKRSDMFELINVRMMLVIQALAPFMIMCTYLFADRLANPMNNKSRSPLSDDGNGGGSTRQHSFSKQYMQHSGLFIRVALSWCFLAASMYTFRPLLQSFLDQATSVASAMATFGEKKSGPRGRSGGGGGNSKSSSKNASKSLSDDTPKIDPFSERYGRLVLTAGRIASFPSFVFAMLAMAHLRAGDGSAHPGIGHQSQPHDAPRTTVLPVKGLIPPYSGSYMLWMDNNKKGSGISKDGNVGSSGDALLQAASMSHMSWEPTPFRDATHRKIADWTGSGKMFCNPPEVRSVKALRRHVTFLLENNSNGGVDGMKQSDDGRGSVLTINAMTGRELLDMAPPLPVTLLDYMMGRQLTKTSSDDSNSRSCNDLDGGYCNSNEEDTMQSPSLWEILDSLLSHNIMTPTVIYPIIDTFAFLSSVWWMYRYTTMMTIYWIQLRTTSSLSETWYW